MSSKSTIRYLINHINGLLPPTRMYRLKAFLWRAAGVQATPTCRIVSSTKIWTSSTVTIGADTYIGHDVLMVSGNASIHIGASVDISPRVLIHGGSHHIDMTDFHSAGEGYSRDIIIEDGVWVGASSTILGGVTIGRKAIIGAGSLVNRSIPPCVIAVGNPCRPIKQWDAVLGWKELKGS